MKIKSTLAAAGRIHACWFPLGGGGNCATWPGRRRRRSFRRPSLRRLCQSAEPQSLDEPPKWRRRKHAAPSPHNREAPPAGCSDPAVRLEVRRGRAGDPPEKSAPERTTRRRNAAAGRSSRWSPATWRRPGRDPASRRREGIAASRRRAWQPAAGRGGSEASALEAKVGPAAGRRRWREPAAGRRGRAEPARRVVRPALRLPRNARPRHCAAQALHALAHFRASGRTSAIGPVESAASAIGPAKLVRSAALAPPGGVGGVGGAGGALATDLVESAASAVQVALATDLVESAASAVQVALATDLVESAASAVQVALATDRVESAASAVQVALATDRVESAASAIRPTLATAISAPPILATGMPPTSTWEM